MSPLVQPASQNARLPFGLQIGHDHRDCLANDAASVDLEGMVAIQQRLGGVERDELVEGQVHGDLFVVTLASCRPPDARDVDLDLST